MLKKKVKDAYWEAEIRLSIRLLLFVYACMAVALGQG